MAIHRTELRVSFGDTDMAGVVYLPQYIHFFIVAWEDFFRNIGIPFEKIFNKEIQGLPPVKVDCRLITPALCGDQLEVHTQVQSVNKRMLTLKFELFRNNDERLLATGNITCVPINDNSKATPIPQYILEAIKKFNI